ncbi:MAG: hypothetical protein AB7F96_15110 [Beijerinckiaceae bacterium]
MTRFETFSLSAMAVLAAALVAIVPQRACAQVLPPAVSPDLRHADTCFSRSYSDSHLRKRPRQMVSRIVAAALDRPAGQVNLPPNTSEMLIGIQTRTSGIWKTRLAYCTFSSGATKQCQLESDGGALTITDRPDGTILIRTRGEIRLGEEDSLAEIGGAISDDNAFILSGIGCRRAPPQ